MADLGVEIKSSFQSEGHKALLNLKYTANYINGIGNEYLKEFNISSAQYNILRILRGSGEALAVQEVRNRMVEKSPNTTRLLDKLVLKNLVHRDRNKTDKRIVEVKITSEGLALLDQIKLEWFEDLYTALSEKEFKEFNRMLDVLRDFNPNK
ncbi:MAG: MarR family winged helix-turn-helix transcriptional regulator [Flavobacteriaceae bacterium]